MFRGDILTNLLSGGLILGACFMMTDYASVAQEVKLALAIIAGLTTGIIRSGVCYLRCKLWNTCSQLFIRLSGDDFKPHIYGVKVKKKARHY